MKSGISSETSGSNTGSNTGSRILGAIFRSRLFPDLFQSAALVIYAGLVWTSLGIDVPQGVNPKMFAQNTMTSLVVWGIWLPLLVIVTVFFGRIWCSVCPLELVQRAGDWIGKKISGKKWHVPQYLRNGMAGVIIYGFLLFMVIATRFPQVPGNTATLLIILFLFSLLSGIFFGNRIFCRFFCPADVLLKALGRRGMLRIRHGVSDDGSAESTTDSSVAIKSCPNGLNPRKLTDSSPCTLCGRCVKSRTDVHPVLRPMPSTPDDTWKDYGWAITLLGIFLSGFLFEHMFKHWQTGNEYYVFIPSMLKKAVGVKAFSGVIDGMWSMLIVPGAVWLFIGLTGKFTGAAPNISDIWKKITLPVFTILTAIQLEQSGEKLCEWAAHFPSALGNLKKQIMMNPFPDVSFLFRIPVRGQGRIHEAHHHSPETGLMIFSVAVFILFLFFLYNEGSELKNGNTAYKCLIWSVAFVYTLLVMAPQFA